MFVTLEGVDACGKGTAARMLFEHISKIADGGVLHTREPGGTRGAEAIRKVMLNKDYSFSDSTLMHLAFAARMDHIDKVLSLEHGIIICERFTDTTYAYQVKAGNAEEIVFDDLELAVDFEPDLTLWLDVDKGTILRRLQDEGADKLDGIASKFIGSDFYENVVEGYQDRLDGEPNRIFRIDNNGSLETLDIILKAFAMFIVDVNNSPNLPLPYSETIKNLAHLICADKSNSEASIRDALYALIDSDQPGFETTLNDKVEEYIESYLGDRRSTQKSWTQRFVDMFYGRPPKKTKKNR